MELTSLIEDPEHASVRLIVSEAVGRTGGGSGSAMQGVVGGNVVASPWISPAPISVKMRLFCLPYAGGVSENVFGRCAHIEGVCASQSSSELSRIMDSLRIV